MGLEEMDREEKRLEHLVGNREEMVAVGTAYLANLEYLAYEGIVQVQNLVGKVVELPVERGRIDDFLVALSYLKGKKDQ